MNRIGFLLIFFWASVYQVFGVNFDNPHNKRNGRNITCFNVFGERCTGTNFLEYLVKQNIIGLEPTSAYGHKHFPSWIDLSDFSYPLATDQHVLDNLHNSDNCLGILIVRDIYDWTRSFYRKHHHADPVLTEVGFLNFLSSTWVTNNYEPARTIDSFNLYTRKPFKNVLELRKFKILNHLAMGRHMKNFLVVRYEDLLKAPEQFIDYIAAKYQLSPKLEFENITKYKGYENKAFKKRKYLKFNREQFEYLYQNVDWELEDMIGYSQKTRNEVD